MKKLVKLFLLTMITVIPLGAQAKMHDLVYKANYKYCMGQKNSSGKNPFYFCNMGNTKVNGENCEDKINVKYNRNYSYVKEYSTYSGISYDVNEKIVTDGKNSSDKTKFNYYVCCPNGWVDVTAFHRKNQTAGFGRYWMDPDASPTKYPDANEYQKQSGGNYTKPKSVSGGTCNQTYYHTPCGEEKLVQDCYTAESCNAGYTMRLGACAKNCEAGQGYESATSNTCVACETTLSQGVDKDGVCQKCSSTQFFNPATQTCKNFSEMIEVTKNAHDSCWLCASPGAMLACMRGVSTGGEFSKLDSALQTACGLTGEGASNWSLSGVVDNSNSNHTPISSIANMINNMPYIPIDTTQAAKDTIQAAKESGGNLILHK